MQPSLSQQTGRASAVSLVVLPVVPLELVAMLVLEKIVGSGVAALAVDVTVLGGRCHRGVFAVDGVDVVDVVALLELPSLVAGSLGPKHAPTRTSAGAR